VGDNSNESGISDVGVVAQNFYSSVRTRSIIEPPILYETFPQINSVDKSLSMDFSRILNKPYFIENLTWDTTQNPFSSIGRLQIPGRLFNNALARIPFESTTLYRAKITLLLQVAGTPMHSGMLIASALPVGSVSGIVINEDLEPLSMGTYMSAPHVFLSANESTSVALEVPFYSNSKLEKTDLTGDTFNPNFFGVNYAEVELTVLNKLQPPTSGSSALTVSVYAMFTHMEFYAPHTDVTFVPVPFEAEGLVEEISSAATKSINGIFSIAKSFTGDVFDALRGGIRALTGLHSPNNPTLNNKFYVTTRNNLNQVDRPAVFEKLDPFNDYDRITRDFIFDTKRDEMSMANILSKPQYLGTFVVDAADPSGTLCWSRPITPFQQAVSHNYVNAAGETISTFCFSNLLQNFSTISKYWKGSLNIHIQSSMSNFHFCKLTIARDYSPRIGSLTSHPEFGTVQNLLTESVEFSAGNQVQTFNMPYINALNQIPCSTDFQTNATQHGIYYIYLNQPLVTNGTVSKSVSFNVYVSAGPDFQYFGYATNPMRCIQNYQTDDYPVFDAESETIAPTVVNPQDDILAPNINSVSQTDLIDMRPIVNIRDYARRMYRTKREIYTPTDLNARPPVFVYPVAELLGMTENPQEVSNHFVSTPGILHKTFLGYSGGTRLKFNILGTTEAQAWYLPPTFRSFQTDTGDAGWASTRPFPLDVTTFSATNYGKIIEQMFSYYNDGSLTLNSSYSVQSVGLENSNLHHSSAPGYLPFSGSTRTTPTYSVNTQLEMEIPNLSPFRFLGDSSKVTYLSDASLSYSSTTDLGTIVLYIPELWFNTGDYNGLSNLTLDIFSSADDVARFGYQVYTPILSVPAGLIGTQNAQILSNSFSRYLTEDLFSPSTVPIGQSYFYTKTT